MDDSIKYAVDKFATWEKYAVVLIVFVSFIPTGSFAYWIQHRNSNAPQTPEQYRPAADGSRPSPGNPPKTVTIEILPLPLGMDPDIIDAAARAVKKWDGLPGSSIQLKAVGPGPLEQNDGDWLSRKNYEDGRSTIEMVKNDWPIYYGPNVIAVTVPKLDDDGRIIEADMFCNAYHYVWRVFDYEGFSQTLADTKWIDAEAIITHEVGHMVGVGHSQFEWTSMYAVPGVGDARARILTTDDLDAVKAMYPSTVSDTAPPSIWRVAEDNFSDGVCGMSYVTLLNVGTYYHPSITFSQPGDSVIEYCLFGSGFSDSLLLDMDVVKDGVGLETAADFEYIGPNYIRAKIMNGSGGYPLIPDGTYDLSVTHSNGETGYLAQGLFINPSSNDLPHAVILPHKQMVDTGGIITLDGSSSYDPEAAALQFKWSVLEAPAGSTNMLSSDSTETIKVRLNKPGLYVIQLVVNDGIIDSKVEELVVIDGTTVLERDRVILRASATASVSDGGNDFSPWGCSMSNPVNNIPNTKGPASLIFVFLLCAMFWRLAVSASKRGRVR